MKHREVAAMSKLQNLTLWKEVNKKITHGKQFQMICQKVNNMIQPSQNFQFIVDDFYGYIKTLKCRFQTPFHSKYPWIEYSVKEDAPFVSAVASGGKEGLHFFCFLKRLKKLSREVQWAK